jgi:hypothetical protein
MRSWARRAERTTLPDRGEVVADAIQSLTRDRSVTLSTPE